MKKFSVLSFALLALACSAWAQPTITIWPNYDSSVFLNASKLYGALPGNGTTLQLLSAPLLSVSTNLVEVLGADCGTWGRSSTVLSNSMRFGVLLPSYSAGSSLAVTMLQSSCSNEPTHQIVFSLRAASLSNPADLSSPSWGGTVYATNLLSAPNIVSSVSFPSVTPGGTGTNVMLLELARVSDQFVNGITVPQLALSYSKNLSPQ